jgi:hypothetical protein
VYLGGDFDRRKTELQLPDREIAGGGSANGERVRRRKKEGRGVGELLYLEGRQPQWRPTVAQGRQRG